MYNRLQMLARLSSVCGIIKNKLWISSFGTHWNDRADERSNAEPIARLSGVRRLAMQYLYVCMYWCILKVFSYIAKRSSLINAYDIRVNWTRLPLLLSGGMLHWGGIVEISRNSILCLTYAQRSIRSIWKNISIKCWEYICRTKSF